MCIRDRVATDQVMSVREHVEEVKKAFLSKFHHFMDEKRDEFHAENPDTTEAVSYTHLDVYKRQR